MHSAKNCEHQSWMRKKLIGHIGHEIVCVVYGDIDDPRDVCIECETCGCVLVSAEDYDEVDGGDC